MKILLVIPQNVSGVEYHRLLIPHMTLPDCDVTAISSIDYQPDTFFMIMILL